MADTTPLNYLVLIEQIEVLHRLFGEVMIPEAVLTELRHLKAPAAVTAWLQNLPHWLRVVKVGQVDDTIKLCHGENEAISLAIEKQVSIVLMNERRWRVAAEARTKTRSMPSAETISGNDLFPQSKASQGAV